MKTRIEEWETDALDAPEGSVNMEGGLTLSDPSGGCGSPGCKCSPGWWISIALPADSSGKVKGWSIRFENVLDMRLFLGNTVNQLTEWLRRPF